MNSDRYDGWLDNAACIGTHPDTFFPTTTGAGAYKKARTICAACPVSAECLAAADDEEAGTGRRRHGIRGGLSPDERYERARRAGLELAR